MSAEKIRRSSLEEFLGGLGIFVVCTVLFALHVGPGWIIVIGVFLGAIPMIKGLRRIGRDRANRLTAANHQVEDQALLIQRTILQLASRNSGIVTPTQVALLADVPIDGADKALQNMTAAGYAEMNIRPNGTIEYAIIDFKK